MSLRLLIDEDTQDKILVTLLKQASHDVVTVNEVNLNGKIDSIVLDFARQENRIILTQNCDDYEALHDLNSEHSGIIAIYNENNPLKNMSFKAIIKAIKNLESANFSLSNQFIALNHWNY